MHQQRNKLRKGWRPNQKLNLTLATQHCSCCNTYSRSKMLFVRISSHYWPFATLCSVCQLRLTAMKIQPACNRAVIPAGSWEEHPSINIHTPSNRFQTSPKYEPIHCVPAHIFIWSEFYPVLTSDDAFWDRHVVTGGFNQRHQGGLYFYLCFFHSMIRLTCGRVLLCPVASHNISSDMITANGCRRDWVTGNAPTLYLDFLLHCLFSDLKSRHFG